jgi:hypothetical protein
MVVTKKDPCDTRTDVCSRAIHSTVHTLNPHGSTTLFRLRATNASRRHEAEDVGKRAVGGIGGGRGIQERALGEVRATDCAWTAVADDSSPQPPVLDVIRGHLSILFYLAQVRMLCDIQCY